MNRHPTPNAYVLYRRVIKTHPRRAGQEICEWALEIRALWLNQLRIHHLLPAKGTNS